MANKPPGGNVSDFVAFAILDELIRTFVDHGDLTHHEAAAMLERVIANVRAHNVIAADQAIPALQEMLREYQRQTQQHSPAP